MTQSYTGSSFLSLFRSLRVRRRIIRQILKTIPLLSCPSPSFCPAPRFFIFCGSSSSCPSCPLPSLQSTTSSACRDFFTSMMRWFSEPRNRRSITFSSSINSPSTRTSISDRSSSADSADCRRGRSEDLLVVVTGMTPDRLSRISLSDLFYEIRQFRPVLRFKGFASQERKTFDIRRLQRLEISVSAL